MKVVKHNYINRLVQEVLREIEIRRADAVVWLGVFPGFPIIADAIKKWGISDIHIMDNDTKKQERPALTGEFIKDIESYTIERVSSENCIKTALYFVSNSHYDDFVYQLELLGISRNQIINLRERMDEWMIVHESDIVKLFKPISGRKLQLTELEILDCFAEFCEERGLRYWLAAGTMLGAIRHNGFIPWDDDIDIYMPWDDYQIFVETFPREGRYTICDWRIDSNYPFQFAKVADENTYMYHWLPMGYVSLGCYIDVFPLGGYPLEKDDIESKIARNRELDALWDFFMICEDVDNDICPIDWRNRITDEKFSLPFSSSARVGGMIHINYKAWTVNRKVFDQTIYVDFENRKFPIPAGYKEYFDAHYDGDYRILPPKDKQVFHSFPSFLRTNM